MKKITFTILHNDRCNFWRTLKTELEALVKAKGLDATIEKKLVSTDEKAVQLHFSGSPQLLINGEDIDPMASHITNYHASGCRPIVYQDQLYDYPPRAMIEEAINTSATTP